MYYPHMLSEHDSRIVESSALFTITNLLPKNVGNWSPAKISVKEVFDAYNPDIPEELRQLQESECLGWKKRWHRVHDPPATNHYSNCREVFQCQPLHQ